MYEDKELQEYRDLLEAPQHFEEGFDWKTVVGAIFIGFLMMPGSMYLQLVIGTGIGPAARWVTIILFAELAKRSYSELKQQEIFLLYYMAGAALSTPFQGLLWNQYLVQSDAARMLGVTEFIPAWVAPSPESESLVERTFFHRDWLIPILLLIGSQIIQRVDRFGLGPLDLAAELQLQLASLALQATVATQRWMGPHPQGQPAQARERCRRQAIEGQLPQAQVEGNLRAELNDLGALQPPGQQSLQQSQAQNRDTGPGQGRSATGRGQGTSGSGCWQGQGRGSAGRDHRDHRHRRWSGAHLTLRLRAVHRAPGALHLRGALGRDAGGPEVLLPRGS